MSTVNTTPNISPGMVVQVVSSLTTAVATGTTVIPHDDSIPQNTEGNQFMTLAITPQSATNILVIEALVYMSNSVAGHLIAALFQDTTAGALAVGDVFEATATAEDMVPVRHTMAAGTTSATTFKIRAGGNNAGTTTFNGFSAGRAFGAITKSSIVIWEYKA